MQPPKRRSSLKQKPAKASFTLTSVPVYVLSKTLSVVQPLAPQIVPLVVFAFLIPLVLALSASAGYAVWRNVATGWQVPMYLQYGDGQPPYAFSTLPPLFTQQPYDISMRLTVPVTESNLALGNFMASLRIASISNQTLITVRKPAIVTPPPTSLFGRTLVTNLDVLLLPSYKPTTPYMDATLHLGRQDGWKTIGTGEGRELAVFDAYLHGVVVHEGLRGIVTRFPFSASVGAAAIFLVVLLSVMGLCILPTMIPATSNPEYDYDSLDEDTSPSKNKGLFEQEKDDTPSQNRRGSRTSRSGRRKSVKQEDGEVPVSRSSSSTPIRRRRSRLSESESEP